MPGGGGGRRAGEGYRKECCPGSTMQMWEAQARGRLDSKEAEEEGGRSVVGSYVLPHRR